MVTWDQKGTTKGHEETFESDISSHVNEYLLMNERAL